MWSRLPERQQQHACAEGRGGGRHAQCGGSFHAAACSALRAVPRSQSECHASTAAPSAAEVTVSIGRRDTAEKGAEGTAAGRGRGGDGFGGRAPRAASEAPPAALPRRLGSALL